MRTDSPDLVIAMRLLDHAKLCGFEFRRNALGEDGPLVAHRVSGSWVDTIRIEGFSRDCFAWRKRTSSLIVPGNGLVERRVDGSALDVLNDLDEPVIKATYAGGGDDGGSLPAFPRGVFSTQQRTEIRSELVIRERVIGAALGNNVTLREPVYHRSAHLATLLKVA